MKVKLIDKSLPEPKKGTEDSAAFDLYVRENTWVADNGVTLVPLNVVVEIPKGHFGALLLRSSAPKKFGIMLANSMGVIDSDYCGEDDEIKAALVAINGRGTWLEKGDRIAQLIILKHGNYPLEIVDTMKNENRGGFGSTG